MKTLNKNDVYKLFYDTIADSLEWADDAHDYGDYVDGVVEMTSALIGEFDKTEGEDKQWEQ